MILTNFINTTIHFKIMGARNTIGLVEDHTLCNRLKYKYSGNLSTITKCLLINADNNSINNIRLSRYISILMGYKLPIWIRAF